METQAIPAVNARPAQVRLRVMDSGSGMSSEIMSHMFEPFFTTKAPGQGTGLGLSTVYGNVIQSGGEISVDSELNAGSSFTLTWPVSTVPPRSVGESQDPARGGHETILLVEDEDIVRHVATAALKRKGYHIIQASSGSDALVKWETCKNKVDLILIDVVMPGMNGNQVAGILTANAPDIPVLFMSGHTEDVVLHKGIIDHGIAFIQKPFSAESLSHKVREILDSKVSAPISTSK